MAIINGKELSLICSGSIPGKALHEAKKFLGSSKKDFVKDGYEPTCQGTGVLMHWDNVPIGYYDVPTANRMVYSSSLWDAIMNNQTIRQMIDTGCFWMENDHKDDSETKISNIAGRITGWEKGSNNFIVGGIDILDTPQGHIAYALAQAGDVGTSTRGFGVLDDIGNGLTNVNEEEYVHVCSDFVTLPACVNSRVTFRQDLNNSLVTAEEEQLRSLVKNAYERCPDNLELLKIMNVLEKGKYDNDVVRLQTQQRIAASLKRR